MTWKIEIINGSGSPLDLSLSSTCRYAMPPLESGRSTLTEQGSERLSLPVNLSTSVTDSCPSPESARWWVYTLTLEDHADNIGSRTISFTGKAH